MRKKFKIILLLFLLLFSTTSLLENVEAIEGAENLKNWSKAEVAKDSIYSPVKYSVSPEYNEDKTKIRTFGSNWYRTTTNPVGEFHGLSVRSPANSEKGKFGVYYDHVGMYKGKELSIKITIMDWSEFLIGNKFISFRDTELGFAQTGYNWVDLKWEYYYTETNKPATDIEGSYLNVIDIDSLQGMEFDQKTTANIEKLFVTNDTWIEYKEENNKLFLFENHRKPSSNEDKFAHFTVLFNEGYSFRFKWSTDMSRRALKPDATFPDDYAGSEWFGFNGKKLIPTETLLPDKFIKKQDNELATESILDSINRKLNYVVYHSVPDENQEFYYNSYTITDKIPNGLKVDSYKIFDETDQDRSSLFDSSLSNNVLTLKAKGSELKKASFYNSIFRIEIETTPIKSEIEKLVSNNLVTFVNEAKVTINGNQKVSNKVTTKIYRRKITINHIDADTKKVLRSDTENKFDGENYAYSHRRDLRHSSGNLYQPKGNGVNGTIKGKDVVVEIPYTVPKRTITVRHIDEETKKVIDTTVESKYDGEKYSYSHRNNLKHASGNLYQPRGNAVNGTVNGKNITLDLLYYVPKRKITINHIDEETQKVLFTATEQKYDGETYSYSHRTDLKHVSGNLYQARGNAVKGTVKGKDIVVEVPYFVPKRSITVNHIDKKTKKVIQKTVEQKYDGADYSYKVRTDLFDSRGNKYRSDEAEKKGKVSGKDITIEIPYVIPAAVLDVEKVEILTTKAGNDKFHEAVLELSKELDHSQYLSNATYKVVITNTRINQKMYEEEFKVTDSRSVIRAKLSLSEVSKAEKVPYKISVSLGKNPDKVDFHSDTLDFATFGYTSTERTIKNGDVKSGKVIYETIAKTEAVREPAAYKEYKEILSLEFDKDLETKAGYGVPFKLEPVFFSQVKDEATVILDLLAPDDLVDSYYDDQYSASNGQTKIRLDRTNKTVSNGSEFKSTTSTFEFPETKVESITGNLFTREQVANRDNRIQHELRDGGRNFYIPVWQDLDVYELRIKSNNVGRNLVDFDLTYDLDVFAYMYATMDSETKDKDELLITPVYPDTELPLGWTDEEIAWLKGN